MKGNANLCTSEVNRHDRKDSGWVSFWEEKATNPDATGKLINDGLLQLLSGDKFYERVVEFMR